MKNKIAAVVMCAVLGFALTGCAAPHSRPDKAPNDATISDNASLDANTQEPELPPESLDTPPASPPSATPPQNTPQDSPPQNTPPEEAEKPKSDVLLCCTASALNVRRGAGTSYPVIGVLDRGDMVMPVRKTGDWYEILYLGASAYASASYFKEAAFDKASDEIERVIAEGKKLLGTPYVYGAQRLHFGNGSPNPKFDGKSYDCSSLMQYIFKLGANVDLAMTSREQSRHGKEIPRSGIRRGDLLFFTNSSRYNKVGLERIGHVALYLGDNIILHTASDHAVIEQISDVRSSYFITARRMLD